MKIAVDVMGTDYGPAEIIKGVLQAVNEYGCDVVLVGDQEVIRQELAREHQENNPKITIHHASQVIEMKDHPGISVKKKRDASIVVATQLLHEKECDALVSSGSTGAAVASALFGLGRIRGIERPAIATVIPNVKGATVLVDSGAKVDAKPEQLVQNAIMGSIYAELQLGIPQPRVGLLNIGEEETKGNEQCLATYPLLKQDPHIHFIGNVEGRDINKGTVDVVVCDGFVGNVVLKTMEGLEDFDGKRDLSQTGRSPHEAGPPADEKADGCFRIRRSLADGGTGTVHHLPWQFQSQGHQECCAGGHRTDPERCGGADPQRNHARRRKW